MGWPADDSIQAEETLARTSDPASSHAAVATISSWTSVQAAIEQAMREFHPIPCDDTDLTLAVSRIKGEPVQRNVVARARGKVERRGVIVRIGQRKRAEGRTTEHYRLWQDGDTNTNPGRDKLVEIHGVAWCSQHRAIWKEGEPWCDDRFGITRYYPPDEGDECDEVSLFTTGEPNA